MRELNLGGTRVLAIEDGFFAPEPSDLFPAWDWDAVDRTAVGADEAGRLRMPIGCFLIEGPAGLALVDTGGGPDELSPPPFTTGRLPDVLAGLGVAPGDIAVIVHSHLHFDHFYGDVDAAGDPAFPAATIFVHADELAWGRTQERTARWLPLVESGRVETVDGPVEVVPGLAVVETPGHTPGHLAVEVRGAQERALIVGDVTHHPIQLTHPGWGVRFDDDSAAADATRARVVTRLAGGDEIAVANHWPAWGRVVGGRGEWRLVPV